MRLAFCLFKYFPFGGLQRDFLKIARECLSRGHLVDVYTMQWEGAMEPGLIVHTIKVRGIQNHTKRHDFINQVLPKLEKEAYDLVLGFNKMPGLDVYYAADTCYQAKARKEHHFLYRLTSRYRYSVEAEAAVFDASKKTEILLISPLQKKEFEKYYHTQEDRFHLLPPGLEPDRAKPRDAKEKRKVMRKYLNLSDKDLCLLMVGSGFKTKGLDRSLYALASLPQEMLNRVKLLVIGKDHPEKFQLLAKKLKIAERVFFLGGREDVPSFLLAADLLMHPAYNENTGTVLLEALVAGLPVLTTAVCGYAHYIEEAKAGIVLDSPFQQEKMNQILLEMLSQQKSSVWQENALHYAEKADFYSMPRQAVNCLESLR